jgi:hypothetical protein
MMEDADAKEDNTFSDFTLAIPRTEIWIIDRETFSTPLLMFTLMFWMPQSSFRAASIWSSSKGRTSGAHESIRNNF